MRHHETGQGGGQLALGGVEALDGLLVEVVEVDLRLCGLGARLDHLLEGRLLVFGVSLDRVDEIGNEVGPPLVLVLDVRPLGRNGLPAAHHLVVVSFEPEECGQDNDDNHSNYDITLFHVLFGLNVSLYRKDKRKS